MRYLVVIWLLIGFQFNGLNQSNYVSINDSVFQVGETLLFKDISFVKCDGGKECIDSVCIKTLDSLALFLIDNEEIVFEIGIHYDGKTGARERVRSHNLSFERAVKITSFLISRGVSETNVNARGYADNSPLTVFKVGKDYLVNMPQDVSGLEKIVLTDKYIEHFKETNEKLYDLLHSLNQRLEVKIIAIMD